jgi:quercetin dioxygenase-like cupin family protein
MPFYKLSEMQLKQKRPGISGKIISGQNMQMAFIKLEVGATTNHCHINEQMGYVLSGVVEISIGDEKKECSAGDAYLIPSNVIHGFKALSKNGVEYLEIFSPPKEENLQWYFSG